MKNPTSCKGFTLTELLVVVLIIGVLTSVAMPMYKHAALKSRFATVMPMAKAIADANEVYYQGRQMYALSQDELDVTPVTAENTSVTLSTEAEEDKYAYVAAQRSDIPGVRYIMYQKYSPMFAGTIQCEADESNEDALWLCEKGLNGTEISGSVNTSQGSYRTFLLSGTAGTADKLPTSISKLKTQICGTQFEGDNCIVDEENKTITTKQCGGSGSFSYINFFGDSQTNGSSGCKLLVYDQDGESISTKVVSCEAAATLDEETASCIPSSSQSTGVVYQNVAEYTDDSYVQRGLSCQKKDSTGACTRYTSYITPYNNNHKALSTTYRVCEGAPKPDGTCNTYAALKGAEAHQDRFYDGTGSTGLVLQYRCTMWDSNGECTNIYDGTRKADNATISCIPVNFYSVTTCTEYYISPSGGTATTCPADQFDIKTLTCAS